MKNKVLYLISKESSWILNHPPQQDQEIDVIFLQKNISQVSGSGFHTFSLSESLTEKSTTDLPKVSYEQILKMIFEADTVGVF